MKEWLIGAIAISGAAYLYLAIAKKSIGWKYILKPGTMALIILLAALGLDSSGDYGKWIIVGLVFSVFGDIFLMLQKDYFKQGLASFFIAHLLYIAAFMLALPSTGSGQIMYGTILVVIGAGYLAFLFGPVKKEGGMGLFAAVTFYVAVISFMVYEAIVTGEGILIVAALLFYVSDAVLAYDKFARSFRAAEYIVMITYFGAQLLFALSLHQVFG